MLNEFRDRIPEGLATKVFTEKYLPEALPLDDPRRAAIYQRLGIATVAPALWTTERVLRRLVPNSAAVEWVDPSAKVSLVERSVGKPWVGHKVLEIEAEDFIEVY